MLLFPESFVIMFVFAFQLNINDVDAAYSSRKCVYNEFTKELKCLSLRTLPLIDDSEILYIDLSNNTINTIEDNRLKLENLRTLDISNNKISTIYSTSFRFLTNLENINLSHNNISYINEDLFMFNKKLKNVDLAYNVITHIELLTFKHIIGLYYIDVSFNVLTNLNFLEKIYYPSILVFNASNNNNLYKLNINEIDTINSLKLFNFTNCNKLYCDCLDQPFVCNTISHNFLKNYFHACVEHFKEDNYDDILPNEDEAEDETAKILIETDNSKDNILQVMVNQNISIENDDSSFLEEKTTHESKDFTTLYISLIGISLCVIIILLLVLIIYMIMFNTYKYVNSNREEDKEIQMPEMSTYRQRRKTKISEEEKKELPRNSFFPKRKKEAEHIYETPRPKKDVERKYINILPSNPYAVQKVLDGMYENTIKKISPSSRTYVNQQEYAFSPSELTPPSKPESKPAFTFPSSGYISHQQMQQQHNNKTYYLSSPSSSKKKYLPPLNTCFNV